MTRNTTNLLGILIAIIAGIYFFAVYCSSCYLGDTLYMAPDRQNKIVGQITPVWQAEERGIRPASGNLRDSVSRWPSSPQAAQVISQNQP